MLLPPGHGGLLASSSSGAQESHASAVHRERLRNLFGFELDLSALADDQARLCAATMAACRALGCREGAERALSASEAVGNHLAAAEHELQSLRRALQHERNGLNLPRALPFEESRVRDSADRAAGAPGASGSRPLLRPHPDAVVPRCLRYHTPVWDALIWRFVRHVEPSGCSQQAHLLRNYPPYLVAHAAPLDPSVTAAPLVSVVLITPRSPRLPRWLRRSPPCPSTRLLPLLGPLSRLP
jgi:hypothetical protein